MSETERETRLVIWGRISKHLFSKKKKLIDIHLTVDPRCDFYAPHFFFSLRFSIIFVFKSRKLSRKFLESKFASENNEILNSEKSK